MGSLEGQTYCLRWNNHKSNLVEILDALIKMECYVDCTIYVDDHKQFKAHRVVLAANSPYFQSILQDVPMDHCSILFPGVKAFEMQALLEYMYTGEVNVTQSQIPRIMKIAEQLEVKGLYDMTDLKDKFNKMDEPHPLYPNKNGASSSAAAAAAAAAVAASSSSSSNGGGYGHNHNHPHHLPHQSSPITSTSTNIASAAQSSTGQSPPYNYKQSPYSSLYTRSSPVPSSNSNNNHATERENSRSASNSNSDRPPSSTPVWPQLPSALAAASPHLQSAAAAAMLSSVYESGADMNPLKRKKLSSISSMLMSRDTPILRNVLAQPNAADSSQPPQHHSNSMNTSGGSLDRPGSDRQSSQSNGSAEYSMKNKFDEPQSPYTDKSFDDDSMMDTSAGSQNYANVDPRIAGYVPQQQKPEWKRYKQYTRNDILSAIECVRNGMSALQASRKFGVPSRTLYDKVKKMGITTGRPMNRSVKRSPSNGSPAGFPFGLSGMGSPYGNHPHGGVNAGDQQPHSADLDRDAISGGPPHLPPTIPHPAAALLDATFLQQALEARGGDIAGRDALHAMAFAAAAHAAVNGMSTSPGNHGTARSPSPSILMKYMRRSNSVEAANAERESNNNMRNKHNGGGGSGVGDDEDSGAGVEDLSMAKKGVEKRRNADNDHNDEEPASTKDILPESGAGSSSPDRMSADENDRVPQPHLIPSALMMMFKRELSPSTTQQDGPTTASTVIVQPSTKQQVSSPIAAVKEEIRDERLREVAIDEPPSHD